MKRCFIYKDLKSQKFWNIETDDCRMKITYGKLGTDGQISEKTFAGQDKCLKEAEALIKSKVKKGYYESDEKTVKEEKNEAKKYGLSGEDIYDDSKGQSHIIEKILKDKRLAELKYITIGCWGEPDESCQDIIDMFVENKEKFNHVESLFIGDMDYEECEVSWITQGNYETLLTALPNLKALTVKGSNELTFGKLVHENLTSLEIICGGLPVSVIKEIMDSNLPNLEKLVLYIGVEYYGFDGTIENLKPLAGKSLFPKLKHLGFVDSEIQNEITEMVLNSDILPQLEVLQLSYGTLTDKGGQLILDHAEKLEGLKKLDLEYHFLSDEMMKKIKRLPFDVNVSEQQKGDDEDDLYPMLTE